MLIERANYRDAASVAKVIEDDHVFRYCQFENFSFDGGIIDGAFISCEVLSLDWYWGLFTQCVFIGTKFHQCLFRGTSFPSCLFVDCEFVVCQFLNDNLNASCRAEGARVYGSTEKGCKGEEFLFANAVV